jgi:adenine-specific DNA-methyltransferase
LSEVPVVKTSNNRAEAVVTLVEHILAAKERHPQTDVSTLERELDQVVYTLYGLVPEEIQIVESAAK